MLRPISGLLTAGIALVLLQTGCSSTPPRDGADSVDHLVHESYEAPASQHQRGAKIASIAQTMLGQPYRYGGDNPRAGFDCSGLVHYSHRRLGIEVPRTSASQRAKARPVSTKNLQRGDLLFFNVGGSKVSHVGIYVGDNRFIHAPSSNKQVSYAALNNPYWSARLVSAGRFY